MNCLVIAGNKDHQKEILKLFRNVKIKINGIKNNFKQLVERFLSSKEEINSFFSFFGEPDNNLTFELLLDN